MKFEGKIDLGVPIDTAWAFLIDINKFTACLPGIEEVRQIDDKTFEGTLAATVGPISGKFNFRSTILESKPPEQMVHWNASTVRSSRTRPAITTAIPTSGLSS